MYCKIHSPTPGKYISLSVITGNWRIQRRSQSWVDITEKLVHMFFMLTKRPMKLVSQCLFNTGIWFLVDCDGWYPGLLWEPGGSQGDSCPGPGPYAKGRQPLIFILAKSCYLTFNCYTSMHCCLLNSIDSPPLVRSTANCPLDGSLSHQPPPVLSTAACPLNPQLSFQLLPVLSIATCQSN